MAQIEASRANTFERLLNDMDLPELPNGFLSHPVDDFFGDYVDALGQRGLQGSESLELTSTPDSGQYESIQLPPNISNRATSSLALPSAMSLDLPLIPDVSAPLDASAGMNYPTAMYPLNVPSTTAMPLIGDDHSQGMQAASESGMGNATEKQTRKPKHKKQKETDYNPDSPGFLEDSDDAEPKGNNRGTSKTKRNPKQQAQNKQAQQRYRERRKQRFNEMEHTIDDLSTQLEQLQAVQNQNAFLQARRNELEARLSQKEEEVEHLRARLEDGAAEETAGESPEHRRELEDAKLRDCQASVAAHIQDLTSFLKQHSLENVNPTGEGVDPHVVQQLAELVGRGCHTCNNALRVEGVNVLRLMSSDVRDFSRIKCMRKKGKITDILQKLGLTSLQKEQLKNMRQNHLRNLRAVYEARQQLNMQAMALMLPPASEAKDLDGKMACMSLSSYSKCARQTVDLDEILNSIKENLRLEQKQVMEMNYVTMNRLLSPIQGALYLVDMHPAFCDALELANALVSQEKQEHGEPSDDLEKHEHLRASPDSSSDNKSDTCPLMEDPKTQTHVRPSGSRAH